MAQVYLVGEPVLQPVNDKLSKSKKLYNMYGPTEGTCVVTIKRLIPGARVTIGTSDSSKSTYTLGSHRGMVIPGVIGKTFMAGVQGYINLSEETVSKLNRDRISWNGEQMYRTGERILE